MKKTVMLVMWCMMVINSWALYYGVPCAIEGDNLGGVTIGSGDTPFPVNSTYPVPPELRNTASKYLKVEDGKLLEKTTDEKAFTDLPIKYKKQVNNLWVEMSAEEKHMVDLPAKYKNPDGSEMSEEQKAEVDAAEEAARQAAKSVMLKSLENMYVSFLTNQWTSVLREAGLISTNATITVKNTDAVQNMQYLIYFRASGATNVYDYYSNEFSRFKNTLREYYNAELSDCSWHPEIVEIKGLIKNEIGILQAKKQQEIDASKIKSASNGSKKTMWQKIKAFFGKK